MPTLPALLVPTLVLSWSQAAHAEDGFPSPTGGLALGALITPEVNPLGSTWTAVGRIGLQLNPNVDLELDLGWAQGRTRTRERVYDAPSGRINALYHFTPDSTVDFFGAAGAGLQYVSVHREHSGEEPDERDLPLYKNPSQDVLANIGPGVTIQVGGANSIFHLRSDLRLLGSIGFDETADQGDSFANLEWTAGIDLRREKAPIRDTDLDGLFDDVDKCVSQAEDKDGYQDGDGCPDEDNDGDGILDPADSCPDEGEDKDGFEDDDGCPDPDDDKDGVADVNDKCKDVPESLDGNRDEDGCPEEVEAFTGTIRGIRFELNKAVIRSISEPTLEEGLRIMQQFPDLRIRVEGHSDNSGEEGYNLGLSNARAQAVVDWLVSHGIESSRLEAVGYGETRPIADNSTPAGQEANRRVDFLVVPK
jgi:outer membrane protein OmpA-like peptidoglycan-associated protein